MNGLISPNDMRDSERKYFAEGRAKSIDIMENAARALADRVRAHSPQGAVVYIACGPGGNGGDGLACARLLEGYDVTVILTAPPTHPDAVTNLARLSVPPVDSIPEAVPDVWVDCLYGTGLSRTPSGFSAEIIRRINADGAFVIAADLPSGLNGADGTAYDPCVIADETVTFHMPKTGLFLKDGLDVCGNVITADVGFPAEAIGPVSLAMSVGINDIKSLLPHRKRNIHKNTCGHLLIVAGSYGMAGAAVMCTRAALRSGVGLVTVAVPRSILPIIQIAAPQAMCLPLPETDGVVNEEAVDMLTAALKGKSAVAVGCGLTRRVPSVVLETILRSGLPTVIDADGLNLLSDHPELMKLLNANHILTPHPGESKRLLSAIGKDAVSPMDDARALNASGATVLLKGASRVICGDGAMYLSTSGGCGMARGGSGDILTGILGALLAQHSDRTTAETALLAAEIHGLAGGAAQEAFGAYAMNAADILDHLKDVFLCLENSR